MGSEGQVNRPGQAVAWEGRDKCLGQDRPWPRKGGTSVWARPGQVALKGRDKNPEQGRQWAEM